MAPEPPPTDDGYEALVTRLRRDLKLHGDQDLQPHSVGTEAMDVLPGAAIRTNTPQTFGAGAAGAWVQLNQFGTVEWNYSMAVDSAGIRVPHDGLYIVTAQVVLDIVNGGWNWQSALTVNGVANQIWGMQQNTFGVGIASFALARPLRLKRNDRVGVASETSDSTGGSFAYGGGAAAGTSDNFCGLQVMFHSNTPGNVLAGNIQ